MTSPAPARSTGTIRLALHGAEPIRRQLQARLRGATVAPLPGDGRAPDDCDAVVLLDPRPSESELIHRCLEAGRHTLLAARPWLTAGVLDGLAAAASRAGVQLAILNPDRFLPSRQLIRQQIDAGRLGEPGLVRIHRWAQRGAPDAGPYSHSFPSHSLFSTPSRVGRFAVPRSKSLAVLHPARSRSLRALDFGGGPKLPRPGRGPRRSARHCPISRAWKP
jgi:hypothetical protein